MTAETQTIIALALVAAALLYIVRSAWRFYGRLKGGGPSGAGRRPLVRLEPTRRREDAERPPDASAGRQRIQR